MHKKSSSPFPIVGIGASAGGLESYMELFKQMPGNTGMAFVLVSHLDPGHVSMLSEIIQRTTKMPVVEARDHLAIKPNNVYVIPPNRDMSIFHGTLQLTSPAQPKGQRLPIDYFLRSLADEMGEKAVCIILSGTGTDGTLGLRAVHSAGGVSIVQDPATAKYEGMPNSAVRSGFATYVAPLEQIPEKLISYVGRFYGKSIRPAPAAPAVTGALTKIMMLVRSKTGHDFSLYKKTTVYRRIERRMQAHGIENMDSYVKHLQDNPKEVHSLFKELLINVTSFFRDPEAFAALKKDILPMLFSRKPEDYVFRAWVPGCSTGEEAYSIAIALREYMDSIKQDFAVKIYATDIDEDVIASARSGVYHPNITADVSAERLRRFFSKDDAGYRIKKDIREMVVFAVQSVIKDPPFTKVDLLSCRNLLIYLEFGVQEKLFPMFHYALKPGGILLLSPSESIGKFSDLFSPVNRKWKYFQVKPGVLPQAMTTDPVVFNRTRQNHARGGVPERIIKVFEPPVVIGKSLKSKGAKQGKPMRAKELEQQLRVIKDSVKTNMEEQQAFNEEIKSTNEELQSTNEELQSTNEELETSKEELQSVNEELVTVNSELNAKIEQLSVVQSDMKNLLDSTNIGTIFLDTKLTIRRFTRTAAELFFLVPTDVGRKLNDIKANIDSGILLTDAQAVLETLVPVEKGLVSTNNIEYLVRITPYRTLENVIDGVVITFVDVSKFRKNGD